VQPSPHPFLSREQVRAFDQYAIQRLGIPSAVLMENAGRGAAHVLHNLGIQGLVVIACGKGNNGGDGLVIARHLANLGASVLALLFARPESLSADAALHWNIVQRMRLPSEVWGDSNWDETKLTACFAQAEWIVDALFGTGLSGAVRPPFDRLITLINDSRARVLAVDIPSGLDVDTGEPFSASTIRAEHTVTFVASKLGFGNPSAARYLGQVHIADIGVALRFGPAPPLN
jgi:NAD(P)H-hydrate epimerase